MSYLFFFPNVNLIPTKKKGNSCALKMASIFLFKFNWNLKKYYLNCMALLKLA